jgi:hypothetical protein
MTLRIQESSGILYSPHSFLKSIELKLHRTTISPLVLYECKTWSDKLREEHKLRVFENGMLRKIFAPNRDMEKTTQRGALCSVLLTKYHLGDHIKKRLVRHVAQMGGEVILTANPAGERPLVAPKRR